MFGEGLGTASKGPSMNPDRAGTGSADWKRMAHFVTNKGWVWGPGQGETGAHLSPDGAWRVVRQEENGPFRDRECRDPDWVLDRERVIKRGSKGPVGPRIGERVVSTVGNWVSVVQFNSLISDGSTDR